MLLKIAEQPRWSPAESQRSSDSRAANMSAAASPSVVSTHHTSYSSTSTGVPNSRAAATRLDDAINQLRNLKQNNGSGKPYQTHVSTPLRGPVLSPRSLASMNAQSVYPGSVPFDSRHQGDGINPEAMSYRSVSTSSTPNGSLRSPPPTAQKPTIPPQLRRPSNSFSPTSKPSPASSSHSSTSSYTDGTKSTVFFDSQGRCTCCPFGYHVDVDFVNFSQDVQSPTASFTRPPRKPRLSFDSQSPPHSHSGAPSSSSLYLDDTDSYVKPVSVEVVQSAPHRTILRTQSASDQRATSPLSLTHTEQSYRSPPNGQLTKSESNETIDSMMNYSNQIKTTRRSVTSTQLAETMATHLPDHGGTALTISPESVEQIKKHMALSLQRMQELEDQIKIVPLMQERISRLKTDKKGLAQQLANTSGVSCMRSIGVGDYDVDEQMTRIEKVIQTVIQEPPPKPSMSVGVGNYDVNVEYLTEAEAFHTLAEKVQKIREKEIQTWIQDAETSLAERKAAMRSCGVGDGDVFAEPEVIKVKETEIKTVYIEPDKPELRNVGLQAKPTMRDVCIEFSQQEEKPTTRTCGFNVDVNDLMQEMQIQNEEMERVEYGEVPQGQKNAWQMQKHVIQRKFMEAMHKGTQRDLVVFITDLLKRSVRSVGTTVKPSTADFGMKTSSSGLRGHDVGVGDDSVNVTVKPSVITRDSFCTAKPVTRTQPTWTDLILTCDSATNTQSSNAEPLLSERRLHTFNVSTTLELRPANRYMVVKELYTNRQDQPFNSKPRELRNSSSTENAPISYTSTKTVMTKPRSSGLPSSSAASFGLMNQTTADVGSVSSSSFREVTPGTGSGRGSFSSSSSTSSGGRSAQGKRSSSLQTGDISKEYVDELLFSPASSSATAASGHQRSLSPGEIAPESLVARKTEVSEDGIVSEVIRKVSSAPGAHEEQTIRVTKQEGPDGSLSEIRQTDSEERSSVTTRSHITSDEDSVLGSDFQRHKEEMMQRLRGEQQGLSVEVPTASTSSRSYSVHTTRDASGSLSPGGVHIEREGPAQRRFEEEMRAKNSSSARSSSSPSGSGSSISRHMTSGSDDRGDYTEVIEEKESSDGRRKEILVEKTFSSSGSDVGRFHSDFPDFSDYFAKGEPPKGRSDRMMSYDNSTYQSRTTAEEERSKTEMPGDPLKARYATDELSSTEFKIQRKSLESEEYSGISKSPRSIMKKDSSSPAFNRSISFAEEAEVAEVLEEGAEADPRQLKDVDAYSDEEESEVSFEEGTYDGRHGDVSYHCDTDKIISNARSQEEIDIDVELQAACSIVQQNIESGDTSSSSKMRPVPILTSALSVIQQDWFKVASGQQANVREVDGYMACFDDFSTELLEHIVNMADGNGNTVLHYAVSHCNFPIVSLIVGSGVADVNLQNKAGYTPIMLAALSEVNSDSDREVIQQLLSKGNVNLAASQAGQTALMLAVSHGRLEMVQLLLEFGAEINLQDEDGSTALMCATEHGHTEIVKALLSHPDIDISLKDSDGSTALEIALENSQKEIGMLLYAKDQANKASSTTAIKKRTSRIPGSTSRGGNKSSSRVVTVTRRRY